MTTRGALDPAILVGVTEEDAVTIIRLAGYTPRTVRRDGAPLIGTQDFRTDRVNLTIFNGAIQNATLG
jgi:hypothetical protein